MRKSREHDKKLKRESVAREEGVPSVQPGKVKLKREWGEGDERERRERIKMRRVKGVKRTK
jgi:hypothetical protein